MSGLGRQPTVPPAVATMPDVALVQTRLSALEAAIVKAGDGSLRPERDRAVLVDAARAALDRLADPDGAAAAEPAAGEASLPEGVILAHSFALRDRLAVGGLAEIYQARHRDLQTDYAIKILKPESALDPLVVSFFKAEARALLALRHDAIVTGHMCLRHADGRLFLVMDLLRGPTLAQRMEHGPMALDELTDLARRLAAALEAVHDAGFVHGDVSPDNVILTGGGAGAVLIDFGVVRSVGDDPVAVEFAGKYSIAAPEQLKGDPISAAVDLYALGLLLVGAAHGERFPGGRDREGALAVRAAMPAVTVPEPLGDVVRRLLDPNPQHRPAAAQVQREIGGNEGSVIARVLSGLRLR